MAAKALALRNKNDAGALVRTFHLPLNKLDATAAPGVGDDDADGFVGGSLWIDRTNDVAYICLDNATGAAVWQEIGEGGGGSGDTALVYSNTSVPGGNTIANTTTETAFESEYTIPGGLLLSGDVVRLDLFGVYSTREEDTPQSIVLRVYWNESLMLETDALDLLPERVNLGWNAVAQFLVFGGGGYSGEGEIPVPGQVDAQGTVRFDSVAGQAILDSPANADGIGVDTSVDQTITVTVEWGSAHADNSITLRQFPVLHYPAP